jgi:hypothetical protein
MLLTPEQLSRLAEAGMPDVTNFTLADQDDVTFELQKGRLDKDGDGSTVIVRGGMDYDSDTGTVTVNSPLPCGPDGILVDANGKVLLPTSPTRLSPPLTTLHTSSRALLAVETRVIQSVFDTICWLVLENSAGQLCNMTRVASHTSSHGQRHL